MHTLSILVFHASPPTRPHPPSLDYNRPFPLTTKPLLRPETCRSPKHRRPTPQVRDASKSLSLHVAHVVHGPSLVESGPCLGWEELLSYVRSIGPLSYAPLFSFRLRFPALHSTASSFTLAL